MLEDIRRIFRQSIDAFREEIRTKEPEDQISDLLTAMRRELVAARAALSEYEESVRRSAADLARERQALTECDRRGKLAERIGDTETMQVARDFAAGHRERIGVLEKRLSAAEAELKFRRSEAEEMKRRYQQADANRFALLAELRRTRAANGMRSSLADEEGPLGSWRRMEERVERDSAYADALDEVADAEASRPPRIDPAELDARLAELKRRMGKK